MSGVIFVLNGWFLVIKIIELYLLMLWVKVSVKFVMSVGNKIGKIILVIICKWLVFNVDVVFFNFVFKLLRIGCIVCIIKGILIKISVKVILIGV